MGARRPFKLPTTPSRSRWHTSDGEPAAREREGPNERQRGTLREEKLRTNGFRNDDDYVGNVDEAHSLSASAMPAVYLACSVSRQHA